MEVSSKEEPYEIIEDISTVKTEFIRKLEDEVKSSDVIDYLSAFDKFNLNSPSLLEEFQANKSISNHERHSSPRKPASNLKWLHSISPDKLYNLKLNSHKATTFQPSCNNQDTDIEKGDSSYNINIDFNEADSSIIAQEDGSFKKKISLINSNKRPRFLHIPHSTSVDISLIPVNPSKLLSKIPSGLTIQFWLIISVNCLFKERCKTYAVDLLWDDERGHYEHCILKVNVTRRLPVLSYDKENLEFHVVSGEVISNNQILRFSNKVNEALVSLKLSQKSIFSLSSYEFLIKENDTFDVNVSLFSELSIEDDDLVDQITVQVDSGLFEYSIPLRAIFLKSNCSIGFKSSSYVTKCKNINEDYNVEFTIANLIPFEMKSTLKATIITGSSILMFKDKIDVSEITEAIIIEPSSSIEKSVSVKIMCSEISSSAEIQIEVIDAKNHVITKASFNIYVKPSLLKLDLLKTIEIEVSNNNCVESAILVSNEGEFTALISEIKITSIEKENTEADFPELIDLFFVPFEDHIAIDPQSKISLPLILNSKHPKLEPSRYKLNIQIQDDDLNKFISYMEVFIKLPQYVIETNPNEIHFGTFPVTESKFEDSLLQKSFLITNKIDRKIEFEIIRKENSAFMLSTAKGTLEPFENKKIGVRMDNPKSIQEDLIISTDMSRNLSKVSLICSQFQAKVDYRRETETFSFFKKSLYTGNIIVSNPNPVPISIKIETLAFTLPIEIKIQNQGKQAIQSSSSITFPFSIQCLDRFDNAKVEAFVIEAGIAYVTLFEKVAINLEYKSSPFTVSISPAVERHYVKSSDIKTPVVENISSSSSSTIIDFGGKCRVLSKYVQVLVIKNETERTVPFSLKFNNYQVKELRDMKNRYSKRGSGFWSKAGKDLLETSNFPFIKDLLDSTLYNSDIALVISQDRGSIEPFSEVNIPLQLTAKTWGKYSTVLSVFVDDTKYEMNVKISLEGVPVLIYGHYLNMIEETLDFGNETLTENGIRFPSSLIDEGSYFGQERSFIIHNFSSKSIIVNWDIENAIVWDKTHPIRFALNDMLYLEESKIQSQITARTTLSDKKKPFLIAEDSIVLEPMSSKIVKVIHKSKDEGVHLSMLIGMISVIEQKDIVNQPRPMFLNNFYSSLLKFDVELLKLFLLGRAIRPDILIDTRSIPIAGSKIKKLIELKNNIEVTVEVIDIKVEKNFSVEPTRIILKPSLMERILFSAQFSQQGDIPERTKLIFVFSNGTKQKIELKLMK